MQILISPADVLQLAFSDEELVAKQLITESDILEAETRYIRPILGEALTERLLGGEYPTLLGDYVAVALASWCRYVVQPMLDVRCGVCHRDDNDSAATLDHLHTVMRSLRRKAATLSRRLSDHLNAHAGDYPEYNPKNNPLNYCSIYGDIIQVR